MPLTSRDLRPADIIVGTTNAGVSAVIRNAIGSSVSHCILYVGGSNVVEAIDRGVVNNPLEEALSHATLAIVLRRRNLTVKQRNDVVAAANGFVWKNLPYDARDPSTRRASILRPQCAICLCCRRSSTTWACELRRRPTVRGPGCVVRSFMLPANA